MKKTRIIVAVVVAALMVMGVGYAIQSSQSIPAQISSSIANISLSVTTVTPIDPTNFFVDNSGTIHMLGNTVAPNRSLVYTVNITNNGNAAAKLTQVVIKDQSNCGTLTVGIGKDMFKIYSAVGSTQTTVPAPANQSFVINAGETKPLSFTIALPMDGNYSSFNGAAFGFNVDTDFVVQ